jgi:hypothetical protein
MRWPVAAAAAVLASACGTPATPARLSASFTDTFGGLYVAQQVQLGRGEVTRAALNASAQCRRTGPGVNGPGEDWLCLVAYVDGDAASRQSFEVQVKPDGCWKAEAPPTVQPAILVDPVTGASSVNHLAEFDGCFDTSW